MSVVDKVKTLCKERKIAISRLERDLGFGNGYISQLRKGTLPNDRMAKIANYLGVSIEFLMGEPTQKEKDPAVSDEADDVTKELYSIWSTASEEERAMLLDMARVIKSRRKKD